MELTLNLSNIEGRFGLEKACELTKAAGFTAIDYSLGSMDRPGTPLNSEDWEEVARGIRETVEKAGLKVVQTHTPFTFKNWNDPETYENFIYPTIVRSVIVSAMLGAKVAVVHPLHHFPYHGHEEEIFGKNMAFYRSLIPTCEQYGINVGIENMFQVDPRRRHIVFDTCGTKEEFVRYIDTLNDPHMVATLDTGHIGLPLGDDEAWDVARALGPRLQSLHVHDNDYRNDQHVLPYLGAINWLELTKALGEIDYRGDFTYEVGGFIRDNMDDEFVPTALKYMADVGKHLMDLIDRSRPRK